MGAHNSGEELHEEDFMVEGETFVVVVEDVVEFFAKCLGVVEELEGWEVGCCFDFVVAFLGLKG